MDRISLGQWYQRVSQRVQELTGQVVQLRLHRSERGEQRVTCTWHDGETRQVILAAMEQVLAEIGGFEELGGTEVEAQRRLTRLTRVELVLAAAQIEPGVLNLLSEQTGGYADGGSPTTPQGTTETLEACSSILQSRPLAELELPVTEDTHLRELAQIICACTPGIGLDLTLLPEAVEVARSALVVVQE